MSLLTDLFDSNLAQHIQNIHLSHEVSSDRWSWATSSKRQFSVRSAHELASQDLASRSSPLSLEDWSCLWGLKMQHRLKHLLWKMAWNILLVRASLARFVNLMDLDPLCYPFCKGPQESISHIMLEYSFAKILWKSSHWPVITELFVSSLLHIG